MHDASSPNEGFARLSEKTAVLPLSLESITLPAAHQSSVGPIRLPEGLRGDPRSV